MSTSTWFKKYDSDLYNSVTSIMGDEDSPYYDQEVLDRINSFGVTGFYFNTVDAGAPTAPLWIPDGHRLATMIVTGRIMRSATSSAIDVYEDALDGTASGGKMHTILYFKDLMVDFQSLVNLGNLNKHRAMGTQIIIGSPTAGFLKAVTTFVSRFAGRNDIVQLENGTWLEGVEQVQQSIAQQQST